MPRQEHDAALRAKHIVFHTQRRMRLAAGGSDRRDGYRPAGTGNGAVTVTITGAFPVSNAQQRQRQRSAI